MKKLIAIIGIDTFLKKNLNQIRCLNQNDIRVEILTNDTMGSSIKNINTVNGDTAQNNRVLLLKPSFFSRLKQIYVYLKNNKDILHHIEVYPAGRFTFIYVFLANYMSIKTVCIERGDIGKFDRHDLLTSISMKLTYKFSKLVIYKELYMKEMLDTLHVNNTALLYNCIDSSFKVDIFREKTHTFLWVNRLVKERKIEWVVDLIKKKKITQPIDILGILEDKDSYIQNNINLVKSLSDYKNVTISGYVNPESFYMKTKFFLLPSDIVFVNNALLEAMLHGVVPIVSRVSGATEIIEDGIDGLLFEHTKEGFEEAIERALSLSEDKRLKMSKAAIDKVKRRFSCNSWCKRYFEIIGTKI